MGIGEKQMFHFPIRTSWQKQEENLDFKTSIVFHSI